MIWRCVRALMETSPSQSSGQGGGVRWSLQTGHPTAVTDCFHQGAHGLAWEMYMESAAKEDDIYLPAALLSGTLKKSSEDEEFRQESLIGGGTSTEKSHFE